MRPGDRFILPLENEDICIERQVGRARGGGGVAIALRTGTKYKKVQGIASQTYQLLALDIGEVNLVVVHFSPSGTREDLHKVLTGLNNIGRKPTIVAGDLNARNSAWDTTNLPRGTKLLQWAEQRRWKISAPDGGPVIQLGQHKAVCNRTRKDEGTSTSFTNHAENAVIFIVSRRVFLLES